MNIGPRILDLQGVPFPRAYVRCYGKHGTPFIRVAEFGMPYLGKYKWINDLAFFAYRTVEEARKGAPCGGSGFFVAIPSKRWPAAFAHAHAITNWHVAVDQGNSVVRFNRVNGEPEILGFEPQDWHFDPHGPDVAVSPPFEVYIDQHKVAGLGLDGFVSSADEIALDINAGEDLFMVGRFVDYDGVEANAPSFRFGHISILNASIRQPTGYEGRSIVADMHCRSGYSGSPVFIYRTVGSVFHEFNAPLAGGHLVKLLGMVWGQFPEMWELKSKPLPKAKAAAEGLITEGKYVQGMSGMTCIVPAGDILRILASRELDAMRDAAEERMEERMGQMRLPAVPTVAEELEPATTADSQSHKERFTALLGEAAKKRPQGG